MRLLLDTHAWRWWLADEPMDDGARRRIADPSVAVLVSAASVWEIAIKSELGKVRFDGSITEQIERDGFAPLSVAARHAECAGGLPRHHRDPFDRLLIAQAQSEGLVIVTRDRALSAYDVDVLPC